MEEEEEEEEVLESVVLMRERGLGPRPPDCRVGDSELLLPPFTDFLPVVALGLKVPLKELGSILFVPAVVLMGDKRRGVMGRAAVGACPLTPGWRGCSLPVPGVVALALLALVLLY